MISVVAYKYPLPPPRPAGLIFIVYQTGFCLATEPTRESRIKRLRGHRKKRVRHRVCAAARHRRRIMLRTLTSPQTHKSDYNRGPNARSTIRKRADAIGWWGWGGGEQRSRL